MNYEEIWAEDLYRLYLEDIKEYRVSIVISATKNIPLRLYYDTENIIKFEKNNITYINVNFLKKLYNRTIAHLENHFGPKYKDSLENHRWIIFYYSAYFLTEMIGFYDI